MKKRAGKNKVQTKVKPTSIPKGKEDEPDLAREWLTPEIRDLLANIDEPHAPKKRTTVIRLAFAKVNRTPMTDVFAANDVCNEGIWWTKWQYQPSIAAAFEACVRRAQEFADEQTVSEEVHFERVRRQKIARHSADAPDVLADVMKSKEQRGSDRINAAVKVIALAEKDTDRAGVYAPVGGIENTVTNEGISIDIKPIDYRTIVAPLTTGSERHRAAPGEGEGAGDGAALG